MSEIQQAVKTAIEGQPERVQFQVEGVPYEVVELNGREQLNTLFQFEVTCDDEAINQEPFELIGKRCSITLLDRLGAMRTTTGLVAEAARNVRDEGSAQTTIVMRPAAYPLLLSRDSRVFNDMTVQQIVDRVMDKSPAKHRWELSRNYRTRVYTAQYREDDWLFISRLLEEEGIYYWFDNTEEETTLVFSDDSPHAPELVGGPVLPFALNAGLTAEREYIHELASEAHATATKFTVGSFDPWNPALKVIATEGDGIHEMYDAPGGGPEKPEVCARRAKVRYECAQAHRGGVSGNTGCIRLEPGRVMQVFNHPVFDGRYLVRAVTHRAHQRRRNIISDDDRDSYECHFELLPADKQFRPPEVSPLAKQAGIQSGRVVGPPGEEIHVDARGRVRMQLHWDREGQWDDIAGKWMRVAQRGVGNSMMYPRIGWNVMTFMEEGNVDAPTVLSRVHDAEHPPTYPLPANKTRTVFRTLTTPGGGSANEIRFEDLEGSQEMFLNASKDMNCIVNDNSTLKVGNDHERKISNDQDLTVGDDMLENVMNDQTVKISGDEKLEVVDDWQKVVNNDEKEIIKGDRKIEVGSNHTMQVEEDRELKVKGDMVEKCEGKFKLGAKEGKITIKGTVTHKCDGMNTVQASKDYNQIIKGSKTETCKGKYAIEVNKTLTETIKKNLSLNCLDTLSDGSDELTNWNVKKTISGTTQEMFLSATEKITLKVGASTIEIDKNDIRVTTPRYKLAQSSALIFEAGSQIKHNA